jgi:hypothetical protein
MASNTTAVVLPSNASRPCRHFVEHEAKREEIGAGVELLAARLLRRHVVDRSDGHAGRGEHLARDACLRRRLMRLFAELGDAEVEQLRLTSLRDEHVRGLDIAMNDALAVRGIEGVRELAAGIQDLFERKRAVLNAPAQRLALEELHRDEVPAFVDADVIDRADVRMVQRRCDARFAQEPLDILRRHAGTVGQELERDMASKPRVLGFIDDAHSARAQLPEDFVVLNLLADHDLGL